MIIDQFIPIPKASNQEVVKKDKLSRSILKSISWRVLGTIDTIVISYFITGTWAFALSIGSIELIT